MKEELTFRSLFERDWSMVSEIYSDGLDTGNASFETNIPSWEDWDNRHLKSCRIIAEINGQVVGWSALSPISSRCIYGGVAELSVYVSAEFRRKKIGTKLLECLIKESEDNGIWTLQAGVFPENKASLELHKRLDFREIGFQEKIGKLNGVWRDILLLERRSENIGIE